MLKLVSVNIEQELHADTVAAFLKKEMPDVVCMQEVYKEDFYMYEKLLGMKGHYVPHFNFPSQKTGEYKLLGIAIFAKEFLATDFEYFIDPNGVIINFTLASDPYKEKHPGNRAIMWADVKDDEGNVYRIANTHFTWTPEGLALPYQIEDAGKAIKILEEKVKDFVFVGDMNAPRGRETFAMFAEKWKDNIPEAYDSSIDPVIHRAKGLKYVVDVLFTTPKYKAENVRLIEGVSDHKAVVAEIYRV